MPAATARAPCTARPLPLPGAHATASAKPKLYNPRHPERTLLYRIIAEHFETWLELASAGQFDGQGDHHTPRAYVRQALRKYLECGIFAHGFARARCDDCGHDYFVAFSCKGRGVCPSWLRYFMQGDGTVLNMVLRIFLRVIAQSLQAHCPGVANVDQNILHIGAVAYIRQILDHIGVDSELPHISPARGPPLWDDCGAQTDDGTQIEPDWDLVAQPAPEFDVDQSVNW